MGGAKSEWMDRMERRFSSGTGKEVCMAHFPEDKGIRAFIRKNQRPKICSYCGARKSVPLDELITFIMSKVQLYYNDPNDGDGQWDDEDHEWAEEYPTTGEVVFDSHLHKVIPYQVQMDIEKTFDDSLWIRRNPYGGSPDDEAFYDWYYFADLLKHKMRFVFYKSKTERDYGGGSYKVKPYRILLEISKLINRFRLYTEIKQSDKIPFYRSRQHGPKTKIIKGKELGSPPIRLAKANRFSPAGISMFYAAEDRETAIREIINLDKKNKFITSGAFFLQKDIRLIELTKIPYVSIFDEKREKDYFSLQFLERFVENISEPVIGDNSEHIDYVPTQVITEFFRYLVNGKSRKPIDGICYYSVKNGQKCYVLFFDESSFTQDNEKYREDKEMCLRLKSVKTENVEKLWEKYLGVS